MDEDKMALPTGVFRRGNVFWLRVLIPQDLRNLYPRTKDGKQPTDRYRATLGTTDQAEARIKALTLRAEFEREFLQRRRELAPPKLAVIPATLRGVLADAVYAAELAGDEGERRDKRRTLQKAQGAGAMMVALPEGFDAEGDVPMAGAVLAVLLDREPEPAFSVVSPLAPLSQQARAARDRFNRLRSRAVADAIADGDLEAILPIAEAQAKRLGLLIDWYSPDGVVALEACLHAYARARSNVMRRDVGEVIETPALPAPVAAPADQNVVVPADQGIKYLRDVVPDWKAARRPTVDAAERTARALKLLAESGQDDPLSSLTRAHGANLRRWLLDPERRFKAKTALNYWTALGALLNIALDVGLLDRNPWAGMTFEVKDSKTRDPFTNEELKQLFHAPLFLRGEYPVVQKVDPWDAYFGLLLGLWTGARIGEIAQLECADVQTLNGIEAISIHGDAGTIKTIGSQRKVPLAPEVIRLGFLAFVGQRRAAGELKVFPSLHRGGKVSPGELLTEWFKAYRAEVGTAPGPLNGYHRFRHTVRTALAALHVGVETADALTGHTATGSSGRKVYTHVNLTTIRDALARLDFSLDLPRVFKADSSIA